MNQYKCKNCGANMDINPTMVRLSCPYCGTVYINARPLTIEELHKSGMVLNNYKIELKQTESSVVISNPVFCSTEQRKAGGVDDTRDIERSINVLSQVSGKSYTLVTGTDILREYSKVYRSIDKKRWGRVFDGITPWMIAKKDDMIIKSKISSGLPGYTISQVIEVDPGVEVLAEKPRLLNPAVWERRDSYSESYCAQKEIQPGESLSDLKPLKERVIRMKNNEVVLDSIERMRMMGEQVHNTFSTNGNPVGLHLNMYISKTGFHVWSSEKEISNRNSSPVSVIDNHVYGMTFNNYGHRNLEDPDQLKAFFLAVIIGMIREASDWRLYSIYRNHEGYIISFMHSIVQRPVYKEW